jgi:dihydrofolate reductase
MAKLVFGMMQSLDGFVAGLDGQPGLPMPDDALHTHFSDQLAATTGSLFGRTMYEIMRYWDTPEAEEGQVGRAFAMAFRAKPKWVVSTTLTSAGPNATLVRGNLRSFVESLKSEHEGIIEVSGPKLAASLSALGLIDEYQLYLRPVVLGAGKPFFAGPRPPLRLVAHEQIGDTMRLTYVPG